MAMDDTMLLNNDLFGEPDITLDPCGQSSVLEPFIAAPKTPFDPQFNPYLHLGPDHTIELDVNTFSGFTFQPEMLSADYAQPWSFDNHGLDVDLACPSGEKQASASRSSSEGSRSSESRQDILSRATHVRKKLRPEQKVQKTTRTAARTTIERRYRENVRYHFGILHNCLIENNAFDCIEPESRTKIPQSMSDISVANRSSVLSAAATHIDQLHDIISRSHKHIATLKLRIKQVKQCLHNDKHDPAENRDDVLGDDHLDIFQSRKRPSVDVLWLP